MALPDYQSLMLPLLKYAGQKAGELKTQDAVEFLAKEFQLSENDLQEMLPSGVQTTFVNRVGWASTYLKKAGLLESTRRGYFQISERGKEVLRTPPEKIDLKFLERFPEFVQFRNTKGTRSRGKESDTEDRNFDESATPLESLERAYEGLRAQLTEDILTRLKQVSPAHFEKIVIELIVKMGYGGSRSDAGRAVGRSGDGGIDGIIKEDKLGLDVIYLQAKRWDETPVGRPAVMQFAGALQAQKASKGIFITTSRFTEDARDYVKQIGSKVVLIDGQELAELMIDNDLGVTTVSLYPVKRVDSDYFEDEI